MYLSDLGPMGTIRVRVRSCLPPALPGFFQGELLDPFRAVLAGLQSQKQHRAVPNISPFFVCYGSITKSTGAAVINGVMLDRAGFKGQNVHSFSGQICPWEPFVPVQGLGCLWHCFQAEPGGGSKAANRLGDFLRQ